LILDGEKEEGGRAKYGSLKVGIGERGRQKRGKMEKAPEGGEAARPCGISLLLRVNVIKKSAQNLRGGKVPTLNGLGSIQGMVVEQLLETTREKNIAGGSISRECSHGSDL